ncbi:MAG: aldo/keto reductase, partial [Verrucomicrobiaceae bacterium]|nr:aldo/keto reductase [Verrucomicrobiaceae bacterium]
DVLAAARENALGVVGYSPLAQGLLSNRYLEAVPEGSRAARTWTAEQREQITPALREKIWMLDELAKRRGQSLPQMAIAWVLRNPDMTSALIGASEIEQIEENANALENLPFSDEELRRIDEVSPTA